MYTCAPRVGVALQPLQVGSHLCPALIAQIAVFLQSLVYDPFQFRWQVAIEANWGRWHRIEYCFEDDSRAFAMKGQCSRRHLIQYRAEGEQIGAGIEFLGAYLLR